MKYQIASSLCFSKATASHGVIFACCSEWGKNYLTKIDINNNSMQIIEKYYKNNDYLGDAIEAVTYCDDAIYLIDSKCRYVEGYWEKDDIIRRMPLDESFYNKEWDNVAGFFVYNQYLVLVSKIKCTVHFIDLTLRTIEHEFKVDASIIDGAKLCGETIIMVIDDGRKIIEFDINSKSMEKLVIDEKINYIGCVYDDEMYLTTKEKIITIDNKLRFKTINCINDGEGFCLRCNDGFVYVADDIYRFSSIDKELTVFDDYPDDLEKVGPDSWKKYFDWFEDEDNYYFPPRVLSHILIISRKTGKISWYKSINQVEDGGKVELYKYLRPSIVCETSFGLKDFIDVLKE